MSFRVCLTTTFFGFPATKDLVMPAPPVPGMTLRAVGNTGPDFEVREVSYDFEQHRYLAQAEDDGKSDQRWKQSPLAMKLFVTDLRENGWTFSQQLDEYVQFLVDNEAKNVLGGGEK